MKLPWSKPASDSADTADSAVEPEIVDEGPRDPNAPKGRPTPRRRDAQPRRSGPVAPPPMTGKEARARMREKERERRAAGLPPEKSVAAEPSERMRRLMARDAGPERALVRNLVDSRRSLSAMFPLFAIVILVAMVSGMPENNPTLYAYISYAWLAFFIVIIAESIMLSRRIKREVLERYPKTELKMGKLYYYGIMRNLMIRRFRDPKPVVEVGEQY